MTDIILKQGTGVPSDSDLEVAEVAIDTSSGAMYTKLADGSVEHLNPVSTGGGSAVHIGELPPASPSEGQEWLEIPADGDATMWIWDGAKWLQHPSGKDGADGADGSGNIDDATQDGVIATWDDTAKQWTAEGGVVVDASGNVGIGTINPIDNSSFSYSALTINNTAGGMLHFSSNDVEVGRIQAYKSGGTTNCLDLSTLSGVGRFRIMTDNSERMRIDQNGRVDITGSLYVNGNPKIGTAELIETLATLRNATKDETTLEGLRDAIGNAVGGLIEKFEAMQNEAVTQDIQEETNDE